ncbi:MAG: bifunctional hydroxymethylpyrimidine kinase/phosphomethylpyrimidine kinase [Bacteriovoracaceae bacterium]|nr:bifunctional hydroxymethylpyrimidine kinase/phosphomethylpyrimidine kinase [Bacteriovoracaceae bacterium]
MSVLSELRFDEISTGFKSLGPILVVGDLGIDKYTYGDVKRISPEAPVPVLEVSREWLKLGLAANISHNLNTLHVPSTLCGVIGEDLNGKVFHNLMQESSLNSNCLISVPGRPTTFKERIVTNTQQICRVDYESKELVSASVVKQILESVQKEADTHSALIIEDYGKGTFSRELIAGLVEIFSGEKKLITADPSRTTPPIFFEGVTLLKPNQVESELMVQSLGYSDTAIDKMAEILIDKLKLEKIVITMGGDGMALLDTKNNKGLEVIPTLANEVFDVSGAGDTAISAITSALLAGSTLKEACWIGNCAAGVVVGKTGTATVSMEELKSFHKRISQSL